MLSPVKGRRSPFEFLPEYLTFDDSFSHLKKSLHCIFALLPLLALAISGMMYFFFGLAQLQFKKEARQNIVSDRGLYTIRISLKDFNKQAGENEFWYGGKLYDISSYTIQNDSVCVTIFHDEQEESLVKTIATNFEPCDKDISDNSVHIVKHRPHIPDDGKVLVARYELPSLRLTKVFHPLPYLIHYSVPVYSTVLKPPPQLS